MFLQAEYLAAVESERLVLELLWQINRLELETFSNVQFKRGTVDYGWHAPCLSLIRSRFAADQFAPHNLAAVRVSSVLRSVPPVACCLSARCLGQCPLLPAACTCFLLEEVG